jgi:hypothetical protein
MQLKEHPRKQTMDVLLNAITMDTGTPGI